MMPGAIMGRNRPSLSTAFNKLPIEMNKEIAQYLETDQDIIKFRLVCRATHHAIDGDNESFWRRKFRENYAYIDGETNQELKKKYQMRVKHLNRGVTMAFRCRGHEPREIKVLNVLCNLIVESFRGKTGHDEEGRPRCPNQSQIIKFIMDSKHFLGIQPLRSLPARFKNIAVEPTRQLGAVQIMCVQLLFELDGLTYDIFPFDDSQKMVYSATADHPIFPDPYKEYVNMEWTLHCLNFFRHHMVKEEAQTLYETMVRLPVNDRPSAWRAPLKEGAHMMGKNWIGTYAFLEQGELKQIRALSKEKKGRHSDGQIFEDKNIDFGGKIQELELDYLDSNELPWPKLFEDRLHSMPETYAPKTRAQHSRGKPTHQQPASIRIMGEGIDQDDAFFASGWLTPLPPQEGIAGWQRITLMKHFDQDYNHVMNDDLWAYEGVVLPGGRIIVGRWWFANEHPAAPDYFEYSGPFILWAVESSNLNIDGESDSD